MLSICSNHDLSTHLNLVAGAGWGIKVRMSHLTPSRDKFRNYINVTIVLFRWRKYPCVWDNVVWALSIASIRDHNACGGEGPSVKQPPMCQIVICSDCCCIAASLAAAVGCAATFALIPHN